jgi:hypothetical protein
MKPRAIQGKAIGNDEELLGALGVLTHCFGVFGIAGPAEDVRASLYPTTISSGRSLRCTCLVVRALGFGRSGPFDDALASFSPVRVL